MVHTTFNNSLPGTEFSAIIGLIEDDAMANLDKLVERSSRACHQGHCQNLEAEAAPLSSFLLQRSDLERYFREGPVAYAPLRGLHSSSLYLRASTSNIYFTRTERANHWTGYKDGAIGSGERGPKDILSTHGSQR